MSYILLKNIHQPGYKEAYNPVFSSDDIEEVKANLKKRIFDGAPVHDFRIVQNILFEFKCAIKLLGEGEETA